MRGGSCLAAGWMVLAALVFALVFGPAVPPAAALPFTTLPSTVSAAVDGDAADVLEPQDGPYFGSILNWADDSAQSQADRLGAPSAVYEHEATVPMSESSKLYLDQFLDQVQRQGALPVITLTPTVALADIDQGVADALVDALVEVIGDRELPAYLRFAPNMNGTWTAWGQQPSAYRQAFTVVAEAVHARLNDAVMVWSPAAGDAYPFTRARPVDTDLLRELDTDGSGVVDTADDAYAPYFPGANVVDWVGLSLYHGDTDGGEVVNVVPAGGEFASRLGPVSARVPTDDDFYARYSGNTDTPLMLETAAFYSASAAGGAELAVKQTWWRQVFAGSEDGMYDNLGVVLWRDTTSTRAVVGEVSIDWSGTLRTHIVDALSDDLASSSLVLGPVLEPVGTATPGAAAFTGASVTGWPAWLVVAGVALAASGLFAWALLARNRVRVLYREQQNRDLRIDMFRGIAIVFVVINHVGLVSLFQNGTQEAVGMVSGAELFVLLSGVVLGMVYRPRLEAGKLGEVIIRTGERAWKLYRTALAVVLLIFLLSLVPFVNDVAVTTYTDQGAGASGSSATGRVYDLYTNADQLLAYPVNPQIFLDLAMMRLGPWQFNVMGLYVVLLAVSPLILWALSRRWAVGILACSWSLYAVGALTHWRLLPSQSEDSFPVLIWQVLFVTGIVAGYHRREIFAWFSTRAGTIILGLIVLAFVALMLFSWNNPYLSSAVDVRLGLIPDNTFRLVYDSLFERTSLGIGRLVNVLLLVVTGFAVMSAFWRPIHAALGWFFVPLGQATLYVFIMHVFFALLVANITALATGNTWLNTAAYIAILGLLWVMVKTRFLFKVVPR
ncbi:hypothetical protein SAMN06296378_0487 [Salinibacterium xinjiangense]|uniref:GH26 domain-containing protein n=1 Tax=Salinibacterium xinjiangense TaxID=386302 RepID=A0A2C8YR38_9MICO|nr:OpgC domain-containing protein [Salinibacterium xinjiangense]SOE52980.1 hypothetical protein SAMN06296378_0487 [Salinibacterium xinjiangense]